MNIKLEQAKTLSLLDPKPVIIFEDTSKTWIAFWNGVVMTAGHALDLAFEQMFGLISCHEVHRQNDLEMLKVYNTGVLGDQWSDIMDLVARSQKKLTEIYRYYLKAHIKEELFGQYTKLEVFKWFNKYTVDAL